MSGLHEVACNGCGRRHETSAEQARTRRVVRCACGQFVRLDRALVERPSDPVPRPLATPSNDAEDEYESSHLLTSLSEVATVRSRPAARGSLASLHGGERPSRPALPNNPLRSLSPAPIKRPSTPPSDKPLWYVDLGGTETVEMTIEQLIVARRSGKLGEGALVWREGMPRWRPVGTLIPTQGTSGRPTPLPAAPSQPPVASRTPVPVASYERPLATLEFALEKETPAAPEATHSPSPSTPGTSAPRLLTPAPRPETWSKSVVSALPRRTPPPPPLERGALLPRVESVLPPAPQAPVPAATLTTPSAPVSFAADHPTRTTASAPAQRDGGRPRWVSASIALLVCVTASSAGAILVRTIKLRHQPTTLAVSSISPLPTVASRPPPAASAAPAAALPRVVDLESLTVEHQPRRAAPRPLPTLAPKAFAGSGTSTNEAHPPDDEPRSGAPGTAARPKNIELPAAAHANPYTTGSDEPGL